MTTQAISQAPNIQELPVIVRSPVKLKSFGQIPHSVLLYVKRLQKPIASKQISAAIRSYGTMVAGRRLGCVEEGVHRTVEPAPLLRMVLIQVWRERPPPKGGGFGLRLKAGLSRPQGPTRELTRRL